MVRNVASMQSLRDEMSHLTVNSPGQQSFSQPPIPRNPAEAPIQHIDGSAAAVQLCGNDAYTKSLMTKVATGQATCEEMAAFNSHVNQARSLPSIQNLLQQPEEQQPDATPLSTHGDCDEPHTMLMGLRSDFGEQFKRVMSRHDRESGDRGRMQKKLQKQSKDLSAASQCGLATIQSSDGLKSGAQLQYELQLKLLEAQNKKRLLLARAEQTANLQQIGHFEEQCEQQGSDVFNEPHVMPLSEKHSARLNHMREDPFAGQWRKQNLGSTEPTSERNPIQLHGQPVSTADDWSQHRQEWKAEGGRNHSRRSKGLAATHAANEEALRFKAATHQNAAEYTKPFCKFLTDNPTVFHAVDALKQQLKQKGWTQLSERETWDIKPEGHYFVERNGSALIAFSIGAKYKPGNGAAILAGHVDALTSKVKPISQVPNKAGYLQLGVAPYAGALNSTWWDRDLGIGGRVHIRDGDKIVTKLVKLDWPIARIPTLAPHFGSAASGPFDKETQMVPIIGLDSSDSSNTFGTYPREDGFSSPPLIGCAGGKGGYFVETQPPALVRVIGDALGLEATNYTDIVNWELELFDVQPATVGGINREFIFAGRIDDKLCSWAALQALVESQENDTANSSIIKVVGLFDDEEIGSLLRQGAKGNFLPSTMERAVGSLAGHHPNSDLMGRTYANSFMVSSDVTHAVNPNFLGAYLENHAPHLNVGIAIAADSNGHMTTDSVSTTILKCCADKVGAKLQVFQIRNGTPSGGTVGPMLSSAIGVRSIDAGLAQLSMHSIRATTGALDPGLGVIMFMAFLNGFEAVDREFQG
ncbi:hypothetical protein DOTSEDRAFT_72857 [Dothistroma septosporum NZE10]|uniref:Aspartyl aminopeptidase n=1 Tax=Dothistroma septosporum (strain NZE10 / CBS 128990) TaxID=675120 RepID=M2YPS4_DOTSN|nr:hypothetical protein DOTSEDRAFT_72857 [Dothistroma septosporum NZE10]